MSHVVDFKDHLGGGMNNLRFSSKIWEQDWFASNSGFYTNRIRLSEIIKIAEEVGFDVSIKSLTKWDPKEIKGQFVAQEFKNLSVDDLIVSGAHIMFSKLDNF